MSTESTVPDSNDARAVAALANAALDQDAFLLLRAAASGDGDQIRAAVADLRQGETRR